MPNNKKVGLLSIFLIRCTGSCGEALVGFRYTKLVGSTGEIPETITFEGILQPWESAAVVGNAVVNAIVYGIYGGKKIAVVTFPMSCIYFTTYIIVGYF